MGDTSLDWQKLKTNLRHAAKDLQRFLVHPLQAIEKIPPWDQATMLIVTAAMGSLSGCLSSILNRSLSGFLLSLIIVPISSIVTISFAAGFFYYIFLFIFKMSTQFRDLYIINVFAAVPSFLCFIVSPHFPPIIILGVALHFFLLYVAFHNIFKISKSGLAKLMVGLFLIFSGWWVTNSLNLEKGHQSFKRMATPESLDILENELNH
jgi:hypothetical protein